MKKFVLILIIGLAFFACDDKDTHTHDYDTAWKSNATEHWHECTANDGAKTDIAPHTAGDWIIDPQATYDTDGSQHKKCTVCEYTTDTETIAKFKTEQQVQIGGGTTIVNITVEYNRTDTTSMGKIQDVVDWFNLRFNEGSSTHEDTITNLLAAGGSCKIVVDYESNATITGFVPAGVKTLSVSKAWFDTNPTFNGNTLRTALNAMQLE
jgi:hypothetical protein